MVDIINPVKYSGGDFNYFNGVRWIPINTGISALNAKVAAQQVVIANLQAAMLNTTALSAIVTTQQDMIKTLQSTLADMQTSITALQTSTVASASGLPVGWSVSENGKLVIVYPDKTIVTYNGSVTLPPAALPTGIVPNSMDVVQVAPNTQFPDLTTALIAVKDGGTINIAAGTYKTANHGIAHVDGTLFPIGLTINGAGAYKTIFDGQYGIGAGYRLSYGKGGIHTSANLKITNCGFIRCGKGDNVSDGEAGVYGEGTPTIVIDSCAFDDNEDGIFMQATVTQLTVNNCDFGKNVPNGLPSDGKSHDTYVLAITYIHTNSRHYGSVGHCLKSRSLHVSTSGNYFAHSGGRCVDLPDGTATAWTSDNDTFTDTAGCSTNMIGYADESANNGSAGAVLTNSKVVISRYNTIIWNNAAGSTLTFVTPAVNFVVTQAVAASLMFTGSGVVVGIDLTAIPNGSAVTPPAPLV